MLNKDERIDEHLLLAKADWFTSLLGTGSLVAVDLKVWSNKVYY